MSLPAVVPRPLARPCARREQPARRHRRAHRQRAGNDSATAPPSVASAEAAALRDELLALLGGGGEGGEGRMARTVDRSRLERLVEQLELLNPTPKPFAAEASMLWAAKRVVAKAMHLGQMASGVDVSDSSM